MPRSVPSSEAMKSTLYQHIARVASALVVTFAALLASETGAKTTLVLPSSEGLTAIYHNGGVVPDRIDDVHFLVTDFDRKKFFFLREIEANFLSD